MFFFLFHVFAKKMKYQNIDEFLILHYIWENIHIYPFDKLSSVDFLDQLASYIDEASCLFDITHQQFHE